MGVLLCASPLLAQRKGALSYEYYLGKSLLERHLVDSSIRVLRPLLSKDKSPSIILTLGKAYLANQQPDSAKALYEQLSRYRPVLYQLASAQMECYTGNLSGGIGFLTQYLENRVKKSEPALKQDTLLRPCHALPQWDSLWRLEHYTTTEQLEAHLNYLVNQQDWETLLDEIDELSTHQQRRASIQFYQAKAMLAQGNSHVALRLIRKAATRYPKREEYRKLFIQASLAAGHTQEAKKGLTRWQTYDPYNPEVILLAAHLAEAESKYREAYFLAKQYLTLYPNTQKVLLMAAEDAAKSGMLLQSLQAIAQALPLVDAKEQAYLYQIRGIVLLRNDQLKPAIKSFMKALTKRPLDTILLYNAGIAYYRDRQLARACSLWERAEKAGHPSAYRLLARYCSALHKRR